MGGRSLIRGFVWATLLASAALAVFFRSIWSDPKVWAPSLLFNLATMALAVYFINGIVADAEDARRKEKQAARMARVKRREATRKARRQEIAKSHVNSAFLCLNSATLLTLKIVHVSGERYFAEETGSGSDGLAEALQTIVDTSGGMRDYANAVNMQMLTYSRWLTSGELKYLEMARDSMLALVRVPASDASDDQKKLVIFHELTNVLVAALQLAKSFGHQAEEKASIELRDRLWDVRAAWGIPQIKRRRRESESHPDDESAGGTNEED